MPSHAPIWTLSTPQVYENLSTSAQGLSEAEIAVRIKQHGFNELPEPAKRSLLLRFTDQLTHFMALLLWVAGGLAFVSGTPEVGWAVWAVIWINAGFSFWQEFQAEQALTALNKMLPAKAQVYRNGTLQSILVREIVPGDPIQLEEGDRIPADARLVSRTGEDSGLGFELDGQSAKLKPLTAPNLIVTKGSPLDVLNCCQQILKDGKIVELSAAARAEVTATNDRFASRGYRVLGVAAREQTEQPSQTDKELEQNLIFLGLVAMIDPPRVEVADAIAKCHQAGIHVTMVTGDYGLTAEAIAQQIGLVEGKARIVTGEEMSHLSDAQLAQILHQKSGLIFARFQPEQKLQLVQAYIKMGHIVAVTGDGVNDAPALTEADLGLAIGAGTNVAIESADLVLVKSDPIDATYALKLAKATYSKMTQNLFWATGYNVIGIPLAAGVAAPFGILLTPANAQAHPLRVVGAILMSVSTVVVSINAMLLRRIKLTD